VVRLSASAGVLPGAFVDVVVERSDGYDLAGRALALHVGAAAGVAP
jgi:hypothetical protein